MFHTIAAQTNRWLLAVVVGAVLFCLGFAASSGKASPLVERKAWEYREVETEALAIQATLEQLGRDGWEVFYVHGASTVKDEGGTAKLVPHTFYVFAKRPMQ